METLQFDSGETEKVMKISIIDDNGRATMEGRENFTVLIGAPRNGRLGELTEATVVIDDIKSDSEFIFICLFRKKRRLSILNCLKFSSHSCIMGRHSFYFEFIYSINLA